MKATFLGDYPIPNPVSLQGQLDGMAMASASFTVGSRIPSSLIGRTFHLAAIANPPSWPAQYSSVAIPLTILP
ncbi:MAG: hypothetical protein HQ519_08840 [Planctomycetes bacterium]|nr:hypothetical protein [Planctomycetota bacterium]